MKRVIVIGVLVGLVVGVPAGVALEPRVHRCEDAVVDVGSGLDTVNVLLGQGWFVHSANHSRSYLVSYTLRRCTWP